MWLQVVEEYQPQWREFIQKRDAYLKAQARKSKKERIAKERLSLDRRRPEVQDLFDAVADAFVELMHDEHVFAFKYCPTPGGSADNATGFGNRGGIATAIIRKMGFPGPELDPVSSNTFC